MSLVLDATPGGTASNTYCTLAEAETYHAARVPHVDWAAATTAEKNAALVMAARLMDALWEWCEWSTNATQALAWPRSGMIAANRWSAIDSGAIPPELKNAQAEFAAQLLTSDRTLDNDIETMGITSLSAGPVSLAFKDSVSAKVVPDAVVNLLPPWWGHLRGHGRASQRVVRA
jgi:hypothetical protein